MTFLEGLKYVYRESIALMIACPLLALIPVVFELVQHIAEVSIGMYESPEMAVATEKHPLRVSFGLLKIAALTLPLYWATRFFAGGRDAAAARSFDRRAIELFAVAFAFMMAVAAISLFLTPSDGLATAAMLIGSLFVQVLIARWLAAAAIGNPAIGPLRSARVMLGQLVWAIPFIVIAQLPLMIPHYGLAGLAILGPKTLLWPVLIFDSLLVGWLAIVLVAANWVIATRPGPVEPDGNALP